MKHPASAPPSTSALVLAFALVYVSWGTTYLAIREGVQTLPPALFGGVRVGLAGMVVLVYLLGRGAPLCLPRRQWAWVAGAGVLQFVGGNGLLTLAERTVASGAAAVLTTTTPLWVALLDRGWPGGERLRARGWLGLVLGFGGVVVVLTPKLRTPAELLVDVGPLLLLGSALAWSLGSLMVRHRPAGGNHLTAAAYQMVLGGGSLTLIGLAAGELDGLTPDRFTPSAVFAFFYLLVVGSLIGFVAYNWLLGHVAAPLVGTHAYVNPVVALLVGWLLGHEEINGWLLGGMAIILVSLALVGGGVVARTPAARGPRADTWPALTGAAAKR